MCVDCILLVTHVTRLGCIDILLAGLNASAARAIAKKLAVLLGVSEGEAHSPPLTRPLFELLFYVCVGLPLREEACPQQSNGYDCGMYVIALCEALAVQAGGPPAPVPLFPEWDTSLICPSVASISPSGVRGRRVQYLAAASAHAPTMK